MGPMGRFLIVTGNAGGAVGEINSAFVRALGTWWIETSRYYGFFCRNHEGYRVDRFGWMMSLLGKNMTGLGGG